MERERPGALRSLSLATLVVAMLAAGDARADNTEAKELFKRATAHYDLGRFALAAEEYEQLYEMHPDAVLLYNIAQAYRQAGNVDKALYFYQTFLRKVPDTKLRPEVERRIADLEALRTAQQRTQQLPPNDASPLGRTPPP